MKEFRIPQPYTVCLYYGTSVGCPLVYYPAEYKNKYPLLVFNSFISVCSLLVFRKSMCAVETTWWHDARNIYFYIKHIKCFFEHQIKKNNNGNCKFIKNSKTRTKKLGWPLNFLVPGALDYPHPL